LSQGVSSVPVCSSLRLSFKGRQPPLAHELLNLSRAQAVAVAGPGRRPSKPHIAPPVARYFITSGGADGRSAEGWFILLSTTS
jgi:hypothetical protein